MLSRVAESIYWMCRYVERAENVARFISVNLNLNLDLPGEPVQQWLPLVITTGDQAAFAAAYAGATKENVIRFLTFDRSNPNSILSCLTAARENARSVREIISSEMWEHINRFYLMLKDTGGLQAALDNPYDFYEQVRLTRPAVPGDYRRHDDARRGVALLPPGTHHRDGRQNVPHPRRQVLHPAARTRTTSALPTTTFSGRPCCARPARSRCTGRDTAESRRPASSSSSSSTASSPAPFCTA